MDASRALRLATSDLDRTIPYDEAGKPVPVPVEKKNEVLDRTLVAERHSSSDVDARALGEYKAEVRPKIKRAFSSTSDDARDKVESYMLTHDWFASPLIDPRLAVTTDRSRLNVKQFEHDVVHRSHIPSVFAAAQCVLKTRLNEPFPKAKILRLVGYDSMVVEHGVPGGSGAPLFVTKCWHPIMSGRAQRDRSSAALRHEFVVGSTLAQLNSPFFARVLAAYEALPPLVDMDSGTCTLNPRPHSYSKTEIAKLSIASVEDDMKNSSDKAEIKKDPGSYVSRRSEKIASALESPTRALHVVYERVDGVTFGSLLASKRLSHREVVSLTLQVMFSVARAYSTFRFTHNDLHTSNVMVKQMPGAKYRAFVFAFEGKRYVVHHGKPEHAVIIDYGFSSVALNNTADMGPFSSQPLTPDAQKFLLAVNGKFPVPPAAKGDDAKWYRDHFFSVWKPYLKRSVAEGLRAVIAASKIWAAPNNILCELDDYKGPKEDLYFGDLEVRNAQETYASPHLVLAEWHGGAHLSRSTSTVVPMDLDVTSVDQKTRDTRDFVDTVLSGALTFLVPDVKWNAETILHASNRTALTHIFERLALAVPGTLNLAKLSNRAGVQPVQVSSVDLVSVLTLGEYTGRLLNAFGWSVFLRLVHHLLPAVTTLAVNSSLLFSSNLKPKPVAFSGKESVESWRPFWLQLCRGLVNCHRLIMDMPNQAFDLAQTLLVLDSLDLEQLALNVRTSSVWEPDDWMVPLSSVAPRRDGGSISLRIASETASVDQNVYLIPLAVSEHWVGPRVSRLTLHTGQCRVLSWPRRCIDMTIYVDPKASDTTCRWPLKSVSPVQSMALSCEQPMDHFTFQFEALYLDRLLEQCPHLRSLDVQSLSRAEPADPLSLMLCASATNIEHFMLAEHARPERIDEKTWMTVLERCRHLKSIPTPFDTSAFSTLLITKFAPRSLSKVSLANVSPDILTLQGVAVLLTDFPALTLVEIVGVGGQERAHTGAYDSFLARVRPDVATNLEEVVLQGTILRDLSRAIFLRWSSGTWPWRWTLVVPTAVFSEGAVADGKFAHWPM